MQARPYTSFIAEYVSNARARSRAILDQHLPPNAMKGTGRSAYRMICYIVLSITLLSASAVKVIDFGLSKFDKDDLSTR
jgi:hypothetical protein